MIRGKVLLSHSESVATFGVHVQFGRFVSAGPLFVQSDAFRRESELIIGGSCDKQRRRIRRNCKILKPPRGAIYHVCEGGPGVCRVAEGLFGRDRSSCRESDNAYSIG